MSDIGDVFDQATAANQAEMKEVTGARRLMIEAIGAPIVDWLMDQPPTIAMDSLLLVTATVFMSMKYKEGATPLTMLDSYTNSLRTTLTIEMETRAKEQVTGEIETSNSRDTLVGPEVMMP